MKLTATTVKTVELGRGKTEVILFDDDIPGFGLRLREGGSKNFVFQYKLGGRGGKHRRMALGKATAVTIGDDEKPPRSSMRGCGLGRPGDRQGRSAAPGIGDIQGKRRRIYRGTTRAVSAAGI